MRQETHHGITIIYDENVQIEVPVVPPGYMTYLEWIEVHRAHQWGVLKGFLYLCFWPVFALADLIS